MMFKANDCHWFPMRVRNSSIPRLQTLVSRLEHEKDIDEAYVPFGFIKVQRTKMDYAPFLLNYIFIRSTFTKLVSVKQNQELYEPLRFVMHPVYDDNYNKHDEVLFISDKTMEDYKRITAEENEKVIFLNNLNYACKPGQEVQITEGEFTGVIGRIKRIKGLRCVVLPIGKELAPAIVDVPSKHLRYLTKEEVERMEDQTSIYTVT